VAALASLYRIRIKSRLGATVLSAFPSIASELMGSETLLTGWLEDQPRCSASSPRSKDSASNCSSSEVLRAKPLWILNAYTHGNRAAEAEANADG
jgi:hypothetical protein